MRPSGLQAEFTEIKQERLLSRWVSGCLCPQMSIIEALEGHICPAITENFAHCHCFSLKFDSPWGLPLAWDPSQLICLVSREEPM